MRFSGRELRDIAVAWAALGLAFTFFIVRTNRRVSLVDLQSLFTTGLFQRVFVASILTVGVGFLLHELAHKAVAISYGQAAEFRADYAMLAVAVAGGLAGFLFAAPGAVVHGGRITPRQHGLIALAGPVTNLVLAALFLPLYLYGPFPAVGQLGVTVNCILAGFNMIPFGGLDGRKVKSWSTAVFVLAFGVSLVAAVASYLYVGFPY